MGDVLKFQRSVHGMLEAMQSMVDEGEVFELIMFAPNKSGKHWHFHASPEISMTDVLVAKQYLAQLADKLCEIGSQKSTPPPEGSAA